MSLVFVVLCFPLRSMMFSSLLLFTVGPFVLISSAVLESGPGLSHPHEHRLTFCLHSYRLMTVIIKIFNNCLMLIFKIRNYLSLCLWLSLLLHSRKSRVRFPGFKKISVWSLYVLFLSAWAPLSSHSLKTCNLMVKANQMT